MNQRNIDIKNASLILEMLAHRSAKLNSLLPCLVLGRLAHHSALFELLIQLDIDSWIT